MRDLGLLAPRLMVDKGFLCFLLTQQRTRMMLTRTDAPATGVTTYSHKLNSVHLGTPQTSLGRLKKMSE